LKPALSVIVLMLLFETTWSMVWLAVVESQFSFVRFNCVWLFLVNISQMLGCRDDVICRVSYYCSLLKVLYVCHPLLLNYHNLQTN